MRLVSYVPKDDPKAEMRTAGVREDGLVDLNRADPAIPTCMTALLRAGAEMLKRTAEATAEGQAFLQESVKLVAPIPRPGKIVCIGLNYADHARETGTPLPTEPVVFNKFPTAVTAPGDPIVLPKVSDRVDYEAELVVVIGRAGRDIPAAQAMQYVAGYTCGNDVSARDWQKGKPAGQWLLGKTFDTFAPMGPELVTADEIPEPGNLRVQLRLNGQTMQDSRTDQLIFGIPELISYISQVVTWHSGDVLFTGTPPGVGAARKPPVFLQSGDETSVEIEGIGVLTNPVR